MSCHSSGGQKSDISITRLKARCEQGHTPSEDCSLLPPASSVCRHPLARGCITLIFKASIFRFLCFHLYIIQSSVCVCLISLCLTFIRVHVITWRVHLNLITSTKTLSPNEVTITGSRNQDPISLGPLSAKHNI